HVRVRLSGQTPEHSELGHGGAVAPARREQAEPAERRLLRYAPVARTVPARPRAPEVPRRSRAAIRSDDARADRDLDRWNQEVGIWNLECVHLDSYCWRSRIHATVPMSFSHSGRRRHALSRISRLRARSRSKSDVSRAVTAVSRIARFASS